MPRCKSVFRYLGWADPIYKWRISQSLCPSCGGKYFLSMRQDAFMTRCLSCAANATNLSLIPVIKEHIKHSPPNVAWEMSTFGGTLKFLQENINKVITSEFFQGIKSGKAINGVLCEDVQSTSFEDSSLDIITSNQVFEHVENDIIGYRECYRILRKNGALIFSVPLYQIPATKKLAEIINDEIIFYSDPEYHDSRADGPKSILTFWHHSVNDIADRVAKAGFTVQLVDIILTPSQKIPTKVIYGIKT